MSVERMKKPLSIIFSSSKKADFAVIFDRDGVINYNAAPHHHIKRIQDFIIIPNFYKLFCLLKRYQDRCAIVVFTNQRWIENDSESIHEFQKMSKMLNEDLINNCGFGIDLMLCCPHFHDDPHCNCRKPKPGMLDVAMKMYKLPPNKCIVVGNSHFDIETAQNAKIEKTVLVSQDCPEEGMSFISHLLSEHEK